MKKFLTCILIALGLCAHASTITNLSGTYKHGQVFLTWQNVSDTTAFYKVYRSTSPITDGEQLNVCEYLGLTNSHSSQDWNLTRQDEVTRYLRIDSAGTPLSSATGLFVATTLVNGDYYYYAVTVMIDGVEDKTIISGSNSLSTSISETVSTPMPVFQETRVVEGESAEIYSTFISTKYADDQPLMNSAGFLAFDFSLYRNHGSGLHPLMISLHGGGALFLDKVFNVSENEMIICVEDNLPSGANQGWLGINENYDVYDDLLNEVAPTSGINYMLTQMRINKVLDWAFKFLEVDTNRVYIKGTSLGAPGAYFMAITYPERFAAANLDVGMFNMAFENDYQTKCTFNEGKKNRKDGNIRMGTIASNLPSNLGTNTYELLNGGVVIHEHREKNFPFMVSINGKHDEMMGWTEKTFYFDSVNHNHTGGYYFWDNRSHDGDSGTWKVDTTLVDLFRFSKNLSFPAFSDCSLNEDWGNGDGNTGEDHGSVNGSLDWVNEVVDNSAQWQAQIFVRDLTTRDGDNVPYPDSAMVTITPRRVQHFNPAAGDSISWSITHQGIVIQSGTMVYQGGLMTIPGVKVFKDTITFKISTASGTQWYADSDSDGFGDPNDFISTPTQPDGYVANQDDCNDGNAAVHPGAGEVCNSIDDNCNGQTDEGVQLTFYSDNDNDGFGNATNSISACTSPSGYISNNTDCNDTNAAIHPGITEACNTIDDNCNGQVDEGVQLTFYSDSDNDSFGDATNSISACTSPSGFVSDNTDCNDAITTVHPGAQEVCNALDDNCNGQTDEGVQLTFYSDIDNDNFGNATNSITACAAPMGYIANNTDCNDENAGIHPGATEVCNSVDDNCNGQFDEGLQLIFYSDDDNDGFGCEATSVYACTTPSGYVANNADCNDTNAAVHPGVAEVCNEIDDDCNSQIDEGVQVIFYFDNDTDAFGNATNSISACSQPLNYVSDNKDCDDSNPEINPGATDIPDNGIDEDCDGSDAIANSVSAFNQEHSYLTLYPNPTNGRFIVELKLDDQHAEGTVQVMNVIGQKVYDQSFATTNGILQQEIVLDKASPNGIFVVHVIANDRDYSVQLVLQK